jgi:hypothetical protein
LALTVKLELCLAFIPNGALIYCECHTRGSDKRLKPANIQTLIEIREFSCHQMRYT